MIPKSFIDEYNLILDSYSSVYNNDWANSQKNNLALQIITYLPYLAGCNNPRRIALLNTTTFFLASKSNIFYHNQSDNLNILNRIKSFLYFPDGEGSIIEKGYYLLSLIMLQDYFNDQKDDNQKGKYNPLLTDAWEFETKKNYIINKINNIKCKKLDEIFSINEIITQNYWWLNNEK